MSKFIKYAPFIKRIGNRDALMAYLLEYMPGVFNQYCEPFVGDGSVLFSLHPNKAIINDTNYQLINAYQMTQKQPQALSDLVNQYLKHNSKAFFTQMRRAGHHNSFGMWSNLKQAARFIYLNQASLSGKWTTNWLGHCNMAFNPNSKITFNSQTLLFDGQYLHDHVKIMAGDYHGVIERLKPHDLVYLNPPYISISLPTVLATKFFGYFNLDDQRRLANDAIKLAKHGVYVMISNADVPMIRQLYPKDLFTIHAIPSLPVIDANDRLLKDVNEAIIVSNNF